MRISDWSSDVCSSDLPRGQVTSPKIRAFVDFLVERLSFDSDYMQVLCPDARARCIAAKKAGETATTVNAELARASRQGDVEEKSRDDEDRSEEHTSEIQSLMRNSYAVFCLKKKKKV